VVALIQLRRPFSARVASQRCPILRRIRFYSAFGFRALSGFAGGRPFFGFAFLTESEAAFGGRPLFGFAILAESEATFGGRPRFGFSANSAFGQAM